jgi:hypothetical protein
VNDRRVLPNALPPRSRLQYRVEDDGVDESISHARASSCLLLPFDVPQLQRRGITGRRLLSL